MSRKRSLAKAKSDICYHKPHWDLESTVAWIMQERCGDFRHATTCRRRLLDDKTSTSLKRRYNRLSRRVAKLDILTGSD
jgi:hypothetical protein